VIRKLLVANRGEIACRVMRTARRLGVATVAVYSDADAGALHVAMADEAVRIGPAPAAESYLRGEAVVEAARRSGADAVHPGYGFLSENAAFAEACEAAGIAFVGPPAAAIAAMGSKRDALALMERNGVPVLPGYRGEAQDDATLLAAARALGFPLIIKPSAGGGGKGMEIVRDEHDLAARLQAARRIARAAFGDDTLLLERYLERPRHIEIQVFADGHGNCIHLFERDCSVQRRHQKIVEEAPAPELAPALRDAMGEAAVRAALAIGYRGAGTVEFLHDPAADSFHFMEMNTRLQVEHPVTELITGVDLVEWQLRAAAGEPLALAQHEVGACGHAIEVRIYAEDPQRDFLPVAGALDWVELPAGEHVRVDAGVRAGDRVGVHYDPMIAKLIVHGEDRAQAVQRLGRALGEASLGPIASNLGFLRALAAHPQWSRGALDTGFLAREQQALAPATLAADDALLAAAAWLASEPPPAPATPWDTLTGLRLNLPSRRIARLAAGGQAVDVVVEALGAGLTVHQPGTTRRLDRVLRDGARLRLEEAGAARSVTVHASAGALHLDDGHATATVQVRPAATPATADTLHGAGQIVAPMPGRVASLAAREGERVVAGEALVVLEAMKMEHTLRAPAAGVVELVGCREGAQVEEGAVLVSLALD